MTATLDYFTLSIDPMREQIFSHIYLPNSLSEYATKECAPAKLGSKPKVKVTVDIGKQTREKAKDTLEKMAMHQAKTEPVQSGRTPGKKTSRMGGLFMYEHLKKICQKFDKSSTAF